ncbi:MAG: divalent metal cation transporter [Bacteroidales bacterium]|nr:divalent metal cation transporter [Bacteroidales bacterium]
MNKLKHLLSMLGPGLMWAGAAVGVSHLVQSTRAGGLYGFALVGVVIFSNLIKYPFFEFAPRYAAATGQHLIVGYKAVGKWAVALYGIFTFLTMFAIQAAVTVVTASIVGNVFGLDLSLVTISGLILLIIMAVIAIGKYSLIDGLMKIIILTLTISTIVAVASALKIGYHPNPEFEIPFSWSDASALAFVIALAGWMPAPIDISVWHSFWSFAKQKESGKAISLKNALFDFNVGYFGTALLALGFLTLGAILMYGSGQQFSDKGSVFAGQLIQLYTQSIGAWAYVVIAIAALATMFSTSLTCLDAYSRVLAPTTEILFPKSNALGKKLSWIWLIVVVVGSLFLIGVFAESMTFMVDLATTISFVTAPVLAYLNYKAVMSKDMPEDAKPSKFLRIYAQLGIVFLSLFSLGFLYWRFF